MSKETISILEIIKKDIIRQIEYDSMKIIRMKQKLKEINNKINGAKE
jgi:hypothetical protein